jgi:hypothetical protein
MGYPGTCFADSNGWHYRDGGSTFISIYFLDEQRAVMLGADNDVYDTHYLPTPDGGFLGEVDLLAGAPSWWEAPVLAHGGAGFVYGFEGGGWRRVAYDANDGFEEARFPMISIELLRDFANTYIPRTVEPPVDEQRINEGLDMLVAADGDVTGDHLVALGGRLGWDVPAGPPAARRFREPVGGSPARFTDPKEPRRRSIVDPPSEMPAAVLAADSHRLSEGWSLAGEDGVLTGQQAAIVVRERIEHGQLDTALVRSDGASMRIVSNYIRVLVSYFESPSSIGCHLHDFSKPPNWISDGYVLDGAPKVYQDCDTLEIGHALRMIAHVVDRGASSLQERAWAPN